MRAGSGKRGTRVGELLREQIALILLYKSHDPRLKDLTVTGVEMSPDLKQARVSYLLREGADALQVQAALKKAMGFIKQELAREHILRIMPEFFFLPDAGLERAARLDELFHSLEASESGKEPEG
ncbi:MAG: 30S ribosome-binding factor RbfA [Thermodesulfobacteriota bacterium]